MHVTSVLASYIYALNVGIQTISMPHMYAPTKKNPETLPT